MKLSWQFGLDCWKVRNQMVHGSKGGVSRLELERIQDIIKLMYRKVIPAVSTSQLKDFSQNEDEVLRLPYQSQVAWLGQLKYILPDEYNEVLRNEHGFRSEYADYDTVRLPYIQGQIL